MSSCPHYTPIGRTRTGEGDVSPGGWDPGGGEVFPPPPHYTPRRLTHTRVPVVRDGRGPIHCCHVRLGEGWGAPGRAPRACADRLSGAP